MNTNPQVPLVTLVLARLRTKSVDQMLADLTSLDRARLLLSRCGGYVASIAGHIGVIERLEQVISDLKTSEFSERVDLAEALVKHFSEGELAAAGLIPAPGDTPRQERAGN